MYSTLKEGAGKFAVVKKKKIKRRKRRSTQKTRVPREKLEIAKKKSRS